MIQVNSIYSSPFFLYHVYVYVLMPPCLILLYHHLYLPPPFSPPPLPLLLPRHLTTHNNLLYVYAFYLLPACLPLPSPLTGILYHCCVPWTSFSHVLGCAPLCGSVCLCGVEKVILLYHFAFLVKKPFLIFCSVRGGRTPGCNLCAV